MIGGHSRKSILSNSAVINVMGRNTLYYWFLLPPHIFATRAIKQFHEDLTYNPQLFSDIPVKSDKFKIFILNTKYLPLESYKLKMKHYTDFRILSEANYNINLW
jgi:hypothetical protein